MLTVPFIPPIVKALPSSWNVVEPTLSSAYRQWGFASLSEDIEEIAIVVDYFRGLRPGKIVLLGHSTGSQQIMHYFLSPLAQVDGAIMQGSASDREIMVAELSNSIYESNCALAQSFVDDGRGDDILPFAVTKSVFMSAPVSANRWLSLASPDHAGEDDYFSSDLDDKRMESTFEALGRASKGARLSFLYSGSDEYVPVTIDKQKLVGRWHEHVRRGGGLIDKGSGIVEGASHNLKNGQGLEDLVRRVAGFVKRL